MAGRFRSGDHLKVRRPRGYDHHGIYISDDRVIQFGSGITLTDKSRTAVSAVTLAEFVQGGIATVERHGYESVLDTGYHPPADEGWKVVARAEFLLELQRRLPYNLIGHNCEIIANMCASQNWTESYQVRRWFGRKAAVDAVLLFGIAALSRAGRSLPRWATPAIIVWMVAATPRSLRTTIRSDGSGKRSATTGSPTSACSTETSAMPGPRPGRAAQQLEPPIWTTA
jgi:hypothetical protein